jgi:phage shock protein PspC (stress-responsive transcriptional regulator)
MSPRAAVASMRGMDETKTIHRLERRTDRRVLAGVAGGLGDRFGVSPGWFRLAFILSAFAGGMGVAVYVLLWFLMPRADLPRSAAQQVADRFPDAPAWIGVALIGVGVITLTGLVGDALGFHAGTLAWGILLIGGGLVLFRRGPDLEDPTAAMAMPAPPATGSGPVTQGTAITDVLPAMPVLRPPRAPRERSPLGWLILGIALAASGVVAVLRQIGALHLSLGQTLAVPLTIIGVGLLVGAVIGRARWTVLLGLLLVPLVLAGSAFTVPLNGRYGDVQVQQVTQVRSSYTLSGGRFGLDLSRMDPAKLPSVIDVRMGLGSVEVILPKHGVRVEATVNIGDVHMGRSAGGFDVVKSLGDPNATTVVRAHVDVGEVQVWYAPPQPVKAKGGGK